ncbi:putative deoxyUTP pyrophosphatase [Pectobacterium phage DU_PP_V]|uniref:dUTP diphosphatase n=1 Tax=Pectobacterium phage DU_PP_V TaxID=2041492 RepID=A0A2D2W716_9CAUD|nr:dUTPase [Pectobacterium phage DU_PP_V]ATS94089.1 putative deoxyUTP pyrophosphatase [Pectobacterium phage DU_PP_V]
MDKLTLNTPTYGLKATLDNLGCMPKIGSKDAAALDLRVYLGNKSTDVMSVLPAGATKRYRTGVKIQIPTGWCGLILPRSSTGKLHCILANTVGLIDSDYRGELALEITNLGTEDVILENFQRVCQMVVVPHLNPNTLVIVDTLDDTDRGESGWGSSGKV